MSSLTFYVGERPIDPVVVTVTDRSLAGLVPSLVGDTGLADHTVGVYDSDHGQVSITFTAPFTQVGSWPVQVKLTNQSGQSDITDPFTIRVLDPSDSASTITTVAQVESWTGASVSTSSLVRAQGLISLVAGRDLTDAVWLAGVHPQDLFWLRMAVAYQAAELAAREAGGAVEMPYLPGATAITNGDLSITFGSPLGEGTVLAPLARTALEKLSWMRKMKSIQASPFREDWRQCPPDPWRLMYRTSM